MTTETVNGQGFESELNKTEIGSFLAHNKALVIVLVIGILVGVLGYGAYNSIQSSNEKAAANALHTYEINTLDKYVAGALPVDQALSEFKAQKTEHGNMGAVFTVGLSAFDAMFAKKDFKAAAEIVSSLEAKNQYQTFMLGIRRAAVYEEAGELDKAISELELVLATKLQVMEDKLYLDLGRLQMKKGNKAEAKKNFEMLNKIKSQNIFKSLAQYYLQQL